MAAGISALQTNLDIARILHFQFARRTWGADANVAGGVDSHLLRAAGDESQGVGYWMKNSCVAVTVEGEPGGADQAGIGEKLGATAESLISRERLRGIKQVNIGGKR